MNRIWIGRTYRHVTGVTLGAIGVLVLALALSAAYPTLTLAAGVSGKVEIFTATGTAEQEKYQNNVLAQFEKAHPAVKLNIQRVVWPWYTRFQTLLAAGTPPDIWMSAGMYASSQYVEQGVWKDLTPLIQRDKVDLSQYFAPTIEASRFRGMQYGLPLAMYTDALIYNVDLFNQAGLAEPPHDYDDTSWTWDKYLEYGRKLTKDTNGDGVPEIWGIDGLGNLDLVAASYGTFPFTPDFRKAQYDAPGMVKAYQMAQDIQFRYHVTPTYDQRVKYNLGGVAFDRGVAGMLIDFTTRAGNYINRKDLHFDIAAKPRGPAGPKVLLYLDTLNMVSTGRNPEATWELIKYLSRPDVLPGFAVYGRAAIPPTKNGAQLFVEHMKQLRPDVDWAVFIKGAPYAIPVEYWRPNYGDIYNLVQQIGGQITNNEKEVTTGLKELNSQVQAVLDKYWAAKEKGGK